MIDAHQLREELGAVLVGEPTAQKPDDSGEVRGIVLANTGRGLHTSTMRSRILDDDRPGLEPDVRVDLRCADRLAGCDPREDWLRAKQPN